MVARPTDLVEQLKFNTAPGPLWEDEEPKIALPARLPVRLIAYYLPQFHSIPENDEWWGKGFTEWTNVTRGFPKFLGHYQPRLPGALGFYDLSRPEVLRRQAELARDHGIEAFCFHYYWFSGRKVLDTPLKLLAANPDIPIRFCLNWANENWTRTWDGRDEEVLLRQELRPEDPEAFVDDIAPLVRDPRYLTIDGRPLLMVYRAGLLAEPAELLARWRARFKALGLPDPYLVRSEARNLEQQPEAPFDAVAGFPPHQYGWNAEHGLPRVTLDPDFKGKMVKYDSLVERGMAYRPAGTYFHAVCPGWDNDARRPARGTTFHISLPAKYGRWLANAVSKTLEDRQGEERIVFVNAWNEWAEGAYLEPDRHFGFAYLRETARTLAAAAEAT